MARFDGMGEAWRLLPLLLLLLADVMVAQALNVSYDGRAMLLDGKHRVLISAGIHYPRATPQVRNLAQAHTKSQMPENLPVLGPQRAFVSNFYVASIIFDLIV